MSPSTPPSPSVTLPPAVETLLRHFPEEVRAAYSQLRATGDAAAADRLVLAIVVDHMPDKSRRREVGVPADHLTLVDDLGFDSVAITEMVFFIEDLLQVNITNDEIVRVRTVGDLRAFVRTKLAARPGPVA